MNKVLVTIATLLWCSQAGAETWDFEDDDVDREPRGFYFDEVHRLPDAKWRVTLDGTNHVLAQLDSTREEKRYAVAVVKDSKFKDVKLEVKIKVEPKKGDPTGGVVWRYRNSENYLVARIDFSDRKVCLYRVINGNRVRFGKEENIRLNADSWNTLRVEHKGNKIKVYVNDEAHIIEKDRHYRRSGKVGLWTQSDAVTYFDDFAVAGIESHD